MPCLWSCFRGYDGKGRAVGGGTCWACGSDVRGILWEGVCTDILGTKQVPLLYEVATGSMEAYRAAVEGKRARSEEVWNGCGEACRVWRV